MQTLSGFATLMQECWAHNPMVRHTALRISKNLAKMAANLYKVDGDSNSSMDSLTVKQDKHESLTFNSLARNKNDSHINTCLITCESPLLPTFPEKA